MTAVALVDATGTTRRLQALTAIGWTRTALARHLHVHHSRISALLRHGEGTEEEAQAVCVLYDRLWDQWPAGPHAERARRSAQAHGWPVPAAWDDDDLDDPAAGPAPGWQRNPKAKRRSADLAEDALFIIATQRCTRKQAAERIGVDRIVLDAALARCHATTTGNEEGTTMTMSRDGEQPAAGTPHPDPRLAERGWQASKHGLWTRGANAAIPHPETREPEREAG